MTRRILGGAGLITIAQLVGKLASMPASPYLTARVPPEGYGIASLAGSAAGLGAVLAIMGLDVGYSRYAVDPTLGDPRAAERLCWRLSLGASLVTGLLAGAAVAAAGIEPSPASRALIGAIVAVSTPLGVATAMGGAFRRARAQYGRLALSLLLGSLAVVGANLVLVAFWRRDEWALFAGSLFGAAIAVAIVGAPLGEIVRPSGLTRAKAREIVLLGIAATVTAPAYWVITSADRWFLASFWSEASTGVYGFGWQVGQIAGMVTTGVAATWLPEVSRAMGEGGEAARERIGRLWEEVAALYLVVWVAVTAAGGDIVRIFSAPPFHRSAAVVPFIAGGAVLNGFVQLGLTGYVLARRLGSSVPLWALGAGLSVALNCALAPRFEIVGAAAANAGAFLVMAVVVNVRAQRLFPLPVRWGRVAAVAAISLASGGLGALRYAERPLVDMAIKLPLGIAYAAVVLAIVSSRRLVEWRARGEAAVLARKAP
jgi:O-antigen/teichoic acid export membrane protein